MTTLKMTVQANNAVNKNVRVQVAETPGVTKEKSSHITLTGDNGRLNIVLPYEEGKNFELDKEVTVSIE
jgi:hypothetical protein